MAGNQYKIPIAPTGIPVDKRLLDILCCPTTRQPLQWLDGPSLEALNRAVAVGSLRRADGSMQVEPLREGLLTRDRAIAYRIDDGIPVLLADESISTTQVTDFPA